MRCAIVALILALALALALSLSLSLSLPAHRLSALPPFDYFLHSLVGPSGCGKSTLYAMILRWYDASAGAIRIDGEDIKSHSLTHLRARVSLVGQEPKLFSGKVRCSFLLFA